MGTYFILFIFKIIPLNFFKEIDQVIKVNSTYQKKKKKVKYDPTLK